MKIQIGWGSMELKFVPRNDVYREHVELKFVELGDNAKPKGIEFIKILEPTQCLQMAERFQQLNAEFEHWKQEYIRKLEELGD